MKRIFKNLTIIFFVLIVSPCFAKTSEMDFGQKILRYHSYDKALNENLKILLNNNPEIQSLLSLWKASQSTVKSKMWLDDPVVSYQVSNVPTGNWNLNSTPMSGQQVAIGQKIPFPSKLTNKRKIAKEKSNQKQNLYEEKINQLIGKFKMVYYDYLYSKFAVGIHYKNKQRYISLKKTMEAKYASGEMPIQDVLKINVAIGNIDKEIISLKQLEKIYQSRINSILNRDPHEKIIYSKFVPQKNITTTLKALLKDSKKFRPWLQKAKHEYAQYEQEHKLEKKSLLPDFDFSVSYRFRDNVVGDPVSGQNFVSSGVKLNIPFIWSIPKHHHKIQEKKFKKIAKKYEMKNLENEIEFDVSKNYYELNNIRKKKYILLSKIIPASLSSYRASKTSYEAGEEQFIDVITSHNTLYQHELELVYYKIEYAKKRAALEIAVGNFL